MEELETLYNAYYEELEQYANYQQRYICSGGTLPPPPGPGPFPGTVELDKNGAVVGPHKFRHPPSHPNPMPKVSPSLAVPNGRDTKAQVKHPENEPKDDQDEDEYKNEDKHEDEDECEDDRYEVEEEAEDEDDLEALYDIHYERLEHSGHWWRYIPSGGALPPLPRAGAPAPTWRRTAANTKPKPKPKRDKLFSFGNRLTVTGKSIFLWSYFS